VEVEGTYRVGIKWAAQNKGSIFQFFPIQIRLRTFILNRVQIT